MIKILAFDSIFIIYPLRKIYLILLNLIVNKKQTTRDRLLLYRLDKENIFLTDKRNISGMTIGFDKKHINLMTVKFYRFLESSGICKDLLINNVSLYQTHTRQVTLKLRSVLECAYRIIKLSNDNKKNTEIITDKQTISVINEAFNFLDYNPNNIKLRSNFFLTTCITINSLIMRSAAIIKMIISPSKFPEEYFYKYVSSSVPTIVLIGPENKTEIFFSTYVNNFSNKFNIILYNLGSSNFLPNNFKSVRVKRTRRYLRGIFNIKNIGSTLASYVGDILLINKNHSELNKSLDVVDSIYSNKIDIILSNKQTMVLDNYLALEAKRKGIFILADIFEEVYCCNAAIVSSKIDYRETINLALDSNGTVFFKGQNDLIRYRLKNTNIINKNYLRNLFNIDMKKKIIFFASDPLKEESQRYLTEQFLINYFSNNKEFILIIKTHHQDNGNVTNQAYINSGKPSNVILIGDIVQKNHIKSKDFFLFDQFDFKAAIVSSDGFLTKASSSILEALALGVKCGLVDKFNDGHFKDLIKFKAISLIDNQDNLTDFLKKKKLNISDEILSFCGLKNEGTKKFDIEEYSLKSLNDYYMDK